MACRWLAAVLVALAAGPGATANFSVDALSVAATMVVATIQPRTGASGYSWLRIYFYASPLDAEDRSSGAAGRVDAIKAKWSAALQLTVDKNATVSQVDLSLPGHSCTIAESDREAIHVLERFAFDGRRVRLHAEGSHVCDMKFMNIRNETFRWNVDLDSPVVAVSR